MKDPVHSFKSVDYKNIQNLKDSLVNISLFFRNKNRTLKLTKLVTSGFQDIDNRETAALKRQIFTMKLQNMKNTESKDFDKTIDHNCSCGPRVEK